MKRLITLFIALIAFTTSAEKMRISVSLEPFPPMITENGEGLVINLLNEIEKISNLTLDVSILNYGRSKLQLHSNKTHLIGLTPKDNETEEFYNYATELEWSLPVSVDLFVRDQHKLAQAKQLVIGVPTSNADFFSEMLAIPRENFVEVVSLTQLVKMLNLNRIDGIIFERVSVISTFQTIGFEEVYYKQLTQTKASMAVAKNNRGYQLKSELDSYIKRINIESIFSDYQRYLTFPKSGNLIDITDKIKCF